MEEEDLTKVGLLLLYFLLLCIILLVGRQVGRYVLQVDRRYYIYIYIYNRYVVIQERHRHCSRCVIVVHLCARARGGVDVKICIVVGGGQQQPFVGRANREPADPPKIYFFLSYCFSSVTPVREANCGKPPRRAFSIVQQCIIVINIYIGRYRQ